MDHHPDPPIHPTFLDYWCLFLLAILQWRSLMKPPQDMKSSVPAVIPRLAITFDSCQFPMKADPVFLAASPRDSHITFGHSVASS